MYLNFLIVFIIQQDPTKASDIRLNHYNETHPVEKTSD